MTGPETGFGLLHGNPDSVQEKNIAEEVHVQEQTHARRAVEPVTNPSYAINNKKQLFDNGNSNAKTPTDTVDRAVDNVYAQEESAEVKDAEKRKNNFYIQAYSYTTTISLFRDTNVVPIVQGVNIGAIEEKSDTGASSSSSAQSQNATRAGNAEKLERIHWISEDLFRAYPAKISINNQNNSLLARARGIVATTSVYSQDNIETNKKKSKLADLG